MDNISDNSIPIGGGPLLASQWADPTLAEIQRFANNAAEGRIGTHDVVNTYSDHVPLLLNRIDKMTKERYFVMDEQAQSFVDFFADNPEAQFSWEPEANVVLDGIRYWVYKLSVENLKGAKCIIRLCPDFGEDN